MNGRAITFFLIPSFLFIGLFICKTYAEEKSKESLTIEEPLSRGAVESITRKMIDENIKTIAEEKLKIATATITYGSLIIVIVIGLFTIFFSFLAYVGFSSSKDARKEIEKLRKERRKMEKARGTMVKELRSIKDQLDKFQEAANDIDARFNTHLGYAYWRINKTLAELGQKNQLLQKKEEHKSTLLEWAIYFTNQAIDTTKLDKNLRREANLVRAKINLAYFYAELKEKKEVALDYVNSVAVQIYILAQNEEINKTFIPDWRIDCVFVKMRFADSLEEINEAIAFLEQLRDIYPQRENEINAYLLEATTKKDMWLSFSAPH